MSGHCKQTDYYIFFKHLYYKYKCTVYDFFLKWSFIIYVIWFWLMFGINFRYYEQLKFSKIVFQRFPGVKQVIDKILIMQCNCVGLQDIFCKNFRFWLEVNFVPLSTKSIWNDWRRYQKLPYFESLDLVLFEKQYPDRQTDTQTDEHG